MTTVIPRPSPKRYGSSGSWMMDGGKDIFIFGFVKTNMYTCPTSVHDKISHGNIAR